MHDISVSTPDRSTRAWQSIFGWVVGGKIHSLSNSVGCLKLTSADDHTDARLWEQEEVPDSSPTYSKEDGHALELFHDTTTRDESGRYIVQLPKKEPTLPLGESRSTALKRYHQNKRSLLAKGSGLHFIKVSTNTAFLAMQNSYLPLSCILHPLKPTISLLTGFSRRAAPLRNYESYLMVLPRLATTYLSTTFSVRVHLSTLSSLQCSIAFVSTSSGCRPTSQRCFEVCLAVSDRDLHRFFLEDSSGNLEEWRMCRVTFGITCSPFLASKVLLQIAEDHSQQYPEAAAVIRNTFYVDNCLTGASTLEEADILRQDLNSLLSLGRFTLHKWCSSSAELLQCIPAELQEADCSDLSVSSSQCPKTLGVHWNTHSDML